MQVENKIITAYNGAGFDFYFLIDKLTAKGVNITNMILNNGKVMSFRFGSNKVFDLCLFVQSSLDSACKSFKIENAKGYFDHNKIKSFSDADSHKVEVLDYLKLDVLGLKELFEKFNNMMYKLSKANITSYVTLSHMAYSIWISTLEEDVELPREEKKYAFIKKATYGARCYPQKKEYKSELYDDVVDGKAKYDDVLKSGKFIFNADATSLYPASMKGFDDMKVSYPTGLSRWSSEPEKEFKDGKIGFYEINFVALKKLRVPILCRKTSVGGLEWSLTDGQGIYTNIDIQNAIKQGYIITFINECLVWDTSANIFDKYISTYYKLKEDAEIEGNKVLRSIAKLMLNALYGKTLQKRIESTSCIINSLEEFISFTNTYIITDYQIMNDNKILMTGAIRDEELEARVTKPCQMGPSFWLIVVLLCFMI